MGAQAPFSWKTRMSKMTERELNIAAAKYAAIRVFGVVLVIAINLVFAIKVGWDLRNWQWWLLMPALSLFIGWTIAKIEIK